MSGVDTRAAWQASGPHHAHIDTVHLRGLFAARGGYVLADTDRGIPDVVLLASGSDVALRVSAYERLK